MFDSAFLLSILPALLSGLVVTLQATAGGYALAVLVGLILALGNRSRNRIVSTLCRIYVATFRCTPLLVQLYVAYYLLPLVGVSFSALTTGIIALGLYTAAYLSEVFRAGIDAIDRGQWEAADALGLRRATKWRKIVLPQALPLIQLPMGNYLIGMFKETPLLAAITVLDVFGMANDVAGQTYRYTEPYTAAALMLLAISVAAAYLLRLMQGRTRAR
jgi:polar amino acid transport system permease protein